MVPSQPVLLRMFVSLFIVEILDHNRQGKLENETHNQNQYFVLLLGVLLVSSLELAGIQQSMVYQYD